jgi:peptidoglycan/xylan/chitin deacetylase (PgdA/CDA1 family)
VEQLRDCCGAAVSRPDFGAMNGSELEAVARHPLVEIGAHTVSHACLATLAESEQRAEISRSKAAVEALQGGSAASVFSYPNGSFSAATPDILRSLGFSCACTSRDGIFNARTDRYRIPRIWAPNVDAPVFRRWLKGWIAGID